MEGISRTNDGWLVRMHYVNDKPRYQKFFYIKSNANSALKKAIEYRDRIIKRMSVMGDRTRPNTRRIPQKNNTTGYVGITYYSEIRPKSSYKTYRSFFVDEEGRHRNLSFSINKYGQETALRLALLTRKLKRRATIGDLK